MHEFVSGAVGNGFARMDGGATLSEMGGCISLFRAGGRTPDGPEWAPATRNAALASATPTAESESYK